MSLEKFNHYLIQKGQNETLSTINAAPWEDIPSSKEAALKELDLLRSRLSDLQRRFFVDRSKKLLIILQGMDTSGKNSTIRHVFRGVNPQGVHVASFEKPTKHELSHDFLWRIHKCTPGNGEMMIFDRSHYEDILAVRVNNLKPESIWQKRYQHINNFEKLLIDEGTIILKFFLHIDRDIQKQRLQERLDVPAKNWKFDTSDLVARERWNEYEKAHEEVFAKTSQPDAPWYIIPAKKKWARNLLVARIIVARLDDLHLSYPKVDFNPSEIVID